MATPSVLPSSSPRVLTMSFEEGVSITDVDAMRKLAYSPPQRLVFV